MSNHGDREWPKASVSEAETATFCQLWWLVVEHETDSALERRGDLESVTQSRLNSQKVKL